MQVQHRSTVLQSVGWSVLLALLLASRDGPIGSRSMSSAAAALLIATGVGVIVTPLTVRATWAPASLMAALVLARPVAASFDAPSARMLIASVGPLAVVVAAWWMAAVVALPRWITALTAATAILAIGADLAFRDPYRELLCHPLCSPSPWVIEHRPHVTAAAQWLVLASALIAAALAVRAMLDSRPGAWRMAMISAIAVAGALVGVEGTRRQGDAPGSEVAARWMTSQLLLITAAVVAGLVPHFTRLLRRRRVARWATVIESTSRPGGVVEMLRDEVGDPSLTLVEATGTEHLVAPRRAVTSFTRNGQVVAAVEHRLDAADRVRAVASAPVVAALENETLVATARRELADLRLARRSVVERVDEARHRLQRDLHDGAQQRLIALGLELSSMADAPDCAGREMLERAALDAGAALTAVRRIAHQGVPPLLDEQGLSEALTSFSEDTLIPIELFIDPDARRRFPLDVERAVFRFVSASAELAGREGSPMTVTLWRDDTTEPAVVVTTSAPGRDIGDRTADVDRVEALDGAVRAFARDGLVVYEARFPCEW
ncbi:MAG: histidine kinase [Acidimicrobiales bacterium]